VAVFIELVTSTLPDVIGKQGAGDGHTRVRRPLRGLEIKDDTYAYIKLIGADGQEIQLVDSSSHTGYSKEYSNFILQSVNEQRMERQQVIETFGDSYMFLFGEAPRFLSVSAVLINSFDFNWKAEFEYNYDNYLRGTKSLEKGARTYLFYDSNIVEGYIINAQTSQDAQNPLMVQLQFQFYVTSHRNISLIQTDGKYPIRGSVVTPGIDITETLDDPTMRQLVQQSLGTAESGFDNAAIARSVPLRSLTSDNADEYTTSIQPSADWVKNATKSSDTHYFNPNDTTMAARDLSDPIGRFLQGYGIPSLNAYSPFMMNSMGVGPSFVPGGVGMGYGVGQAGTYATFGAVAMVGASGGFAGMGAGLGAVAGAGFGSFSGAYAGNGLGAGAGAGFFGGGGYPTQQSAFANTQSFYGTPSSYGGSGYGGSYGSASPLFGGMSAAELAYLAATGNIFGFGSALGRPGGQQAAYGYPNNNASAGYNSYAYNQLRAASRAGGYAGAGSYMGYPGYFSYAGASQAGQSGAGPAIFVGGAVSAFSFTSAPGTLTNTGTPAWQLYP
jgi:hypothetical protein